MVNFRLALLLLAVLSTACSPSSSSSEPPESEAERLPTTDAVQEAPGTPMMSKAAKAPGQPDFALDARDTTPVSASIVGARLSSQGDAEKNIIGAETRRFLPADTVYVQVETRGTGKPYTLYAKWISSNGTVLADYGTLISDPGVQRTVISLSKPDGWSSGRNRLELAINAQKPQVVFFEVD